MNIIFWDTETNGLFKTNSVLSISAIKCSFLISDGKIESSVIEKYERFYYRRPGEKLGIKAIEVNGLTDNVIKIRRDGCNYPQNFCDDIEAFRLFCSDTRHFVGHNIYYDKQYINFKLANIFCTMKSNTKIIGLKKKDGRPKFPSLEETTRFYDIKIDKSELHGSMYDSFVTYQVFLKMAEHEKSRMKVIEFLGK